MTDAPDIRAKLLNKPLSRKRDRSSIKGLLNECFCFASDFQARVLACGRTYIKWRDGTCGKVPGVPDVEPAKFRKKYPQTTFQDGKPTMTDPGQFDGLDFDNGWGAARVRPAVDV